MNEILDFMERVAVVILVIIWIAIKWIAQGIYFDVYYLFHPHTGFEDYLPFSERGFREKWNA